MSLLMDALRKAEQQKQKLATQGQPGGALPGKLELEPLPAPPGQAPEAATAFPTLPPADAAPEGSVQTQPAGGFGEAGGGPLPDLPSRLEDLDEQFIAHTAAARSAALAARRASPPPIKPMSAIPAADASGMASRAARAPRESVAAPIPPPPGGAPQANTKESSRDAARKLFAAKQPAEKSKRSFAIAVGLVTLIATIGIGAYFWWQLQPKSGLLASGALKPSQPTPATPPAPLAAPSVPAATTQPPSQSPSTSPATAVPPTPTFPPPATVAPQGAGQMATKPATNSMEEEEDAAPPVSKRAIAKPSPTATVQPPIRVTAQPQKLDPLLQQAYDAFNRGELDLAQAAWQKLLQTDPKNVDVLHGLAAIAQQRQQADRAADYYLRALEADPKDALALSGLIALRGHVDPQQTEARIKTLLAEQPDSPFLHFALGNLYARASRWADAQQAYFKAHTADPGNPDYLFNIAVSLDQLHQPRLAAQHYNQALGATAQRPAGFDPAQVAARLKILQPELQP